MSRGSFYHVWDLFRSEVPGQVQVQRIDPQAHPQRPVPVQQIGQAHQRVGQPTDPQQLGLTNWSPQPAHPVRPGPQRPPHLTHPVRLA